MSTEENKTVYKRFIQKVFNEGRLELLEELLAPEYEIKDAPQGSAQGAEGVRQVVTMFRAAFPDLEIHLDELIAEGDNVASRATLTGTHRGAIFGIAPTGRSVSVPSLTFVRVIDGRLVASWVKNDVPVLMRQLGVESPPR